VPTLLLVRHGRTAANATGVLAGRAVGVHLDEVGREQAVAAGARLRGLPVKAVVTSPLERTVETAEALVATWDDAPDVVVDERFVECGYGSWTGRALKDLAKEPLWKTVQAHPSAVRFPDGESLPEMYARAVAGVRAWDRRMAEGHGDDALWVAVSHGDVIKAIIADAYGIHLDQFQRIMVGPASVSVIHYTPQRPFVVHVNDTGSDLSGLKPAKRRRRRTPTSDAAVGGGA
jgi:2,3-bisphosphoglycerate-dependent phosphoglycerate mutase